MPDSSSGLDLRRRRLFYRCHHTGMRETDLILGPFARRHIADLGEQEVDELEALLDDVPEADIFAWVAGLRAVPEAWRGALMDRLMTFNIQDA